jgi:hypothetical protein
MISLWELRAIKKLPNRLDLEDPEAVRHALAEAAEEGGNTTLKRTRRKARQEAWRAVAMLAEASPPSSALQPTLASKDIESLPWEVLE